MSKSDLVKAVAEKAGITQKEASAAVNAFVDTVVSDTAAGNEVALIGFGTFGVKERPARTGRNPRTGESMEIAAAKVPYFKPGKAFKDAVKD